MVELLLLSSSRVLLRSVQRPHCPTAADVAQCMALVTSSRLVGSIPAATTF